MSKVNGLCLLDCLEQFSQIFVIFFGRGPLSLIVLTLIEQEPAFKKHLMTFDGDTQGADCQTITFSWERNSEQRERERQLGHVFRGVARGKARHVLQCAVEQKFGVPVVQFTEDVAKAVSMCQSR